MRCILTALGVAALATPTSAGEGAPAPVAATLGKESAWVGERVPLTIVLRSPGPFSGTAAFDLPELPKTAVLKVGRPVVGSETVDGMSMITQRHEFAVFTQQIGEVTLPPFRVRFESKPDFTSDPEPIEARTAELRFESKRPPGTVGMGVVLSTSAMEVQQAWEPAAADSGELAPGDVVTRRITRKAGGTTAMMFPPPPEATPDGVRVYAGQPVVTDKTERGASSAERVDTIKYQFPTPGTYTLPAMEFSWWNPDRSELQRLELAGLTVTVGGAAPAGAVGDGAVGGRSPIPWLVAVAGIGLTVLLLVGRLRKGGESKGSEPVVTKRVREACRRGDPSGCYSAVLAWAQTAGLGGRGWRDLRLGLGGEWDELSKRLYGDRGAAGSAWSGEKFWRRFAETRRKLLDRRHGSTAAGDLPSLNPGSPG